MSYIPPALRHKQEALAQSKKLGNVPRPFDVPDACVRTSLPTVPDIQNHFWPPKHKHISTASVDNATNLPDPSVLTSNNTTQGVTDFTHNVAGEESDVVRITLSSSSSMLPHTHSTLNSTQAEPSKLKYVLLFYQAVS